MGQASPRGDPTTGPEVIRAVEATGKENPDSASSTRLGSYLRQLREGYGYTLRKVEERAMALGEAIDNSQLSRFEKGKAVPSFEKLRALGRVFNVPVQNFSDVLDLEEFQDLRPDGVEFSELVRAGSDAMARGEHGLAFVTYERALEIAETAASTPDDAEQTHEKIAEARWRMASALKALGKLYMTERELREVLKNRRQLPPRARLRTLLQLSYLYRELGDYYLASVLAKECLDLARPGDDPLTEAGVLNSLGNIEHDDGDPEAAAEYYQGALTILQRLGGHLEMQATVLTNLGGCWVTIGRFEDGIAMLREAHTRAREAGFRRVAALSLTRMAEAYRSRGDHQQAGVHLNDSDTLASRGDDCYHDILFLNTYHRWTMAREDGNGTREKICFGRLRHLRSLLQRRFSEVEEFDRHIERTRR